MSAHALSLTYGEHPIPSLCLPVCPGEFDGFSSGAALEELEQASMSLGSCRWGQDIRFCKTNWTLTEIQNLHPLQWVSSMEETYLDCCHQQLCVTVGVWFLSSFSFIGDYSQREGLSQIRERTSPAASMEASKDWPPLQDSPQRAKLASLPLHKEQRVQEENKNTSSLQKNHDRTPYNRWESTCMIEDTLLHILLEKKMRECLACGGH